MSAAHSAARRRQWQDPDFRAARSAATKAAWQDPDRRARMLEGLRAAMTAAETRRMFAGVNGNPGKVARAKATFQRNKAKRKPRTIDEAECARLATISRSYWTPERRAAASLARSAFLKTAAGRKALAKLQAARWAGHEKATRAVLLFRSKLRACGLHEEARRITNSFMEARDAR